MKTIVHLTSSRFYGGPERQMLGLAEHLPGDYRTVFMSFSEGGLSESFLNQVRQRGFDGITLDHDTPQIRAAYREVVSRLRACEAGYVLCHGYKAGIIGRLAARKLRIPAVGVSRGWTAESLKVRAYELLDRINMRWLDHVVCVSEGQAQKVRRARIRADRMSVICNSIKLDRFAPASEADRQALRSRFPKPVRFVVGSAGRLSPEKGYTVLISAAAEIIRTQPDVGFIVFGDGPLKEELQAQIEREGLQEQFLLAGFEKNLDRWVPNLDLFVNPSFTEGLANVILESLAARVPVVATAVGGTPEIVNDGQTGFLVDAGDFKTMAERIRTLLRDQSLRESFVDAGYQRVRDCFTFEIQSQQYCQLFQQLAGRHAKPSREVIQNADSGVLSH